MVEVEGYVSHQLLGLSDEASDYSSSISVRRFLHLRAQAPTVPNEIVIEAMIKDFVQVQ
jgi:hypothetical protein